FTDRAHLQGMLDFEAALARAEARTGVIPDAAVAPIAAQCDASLYDLGALGQASAKSANTAIPLVKALTAKVAAKDKAAAGFVHWGATSQDAMDTGLVLQLRAALALIEADLAKLSASLAALAQKHRQTPMVGRTWLQHALPITFGLKAAGWLDTVERHRAHMAEIRPRLLVLQFGGAAGTLAALGDKGLVVAQALAEELKLGLPSTPWHGARDRVAEFGTVLALLTGTLGKMARDIALLMQTDVAEAFEPAGEGRGGSSTMPHKRNPVAAAAILAAATRVPHLAGSLLSGMVQEHERGLGGWQAEWQVLPELVLLSAGALAHMVETIEGLDVRPETMRANLDTTDGLIMAEAVAMALGVKLGKQDAHHLVEAASKRALAEKRHLRDVLADDKTVAQHLDRAALDRLFDPLGYAGVAEAFIDRVLAARRK
ncbi:MAG: 3-carboxy-cis,cis-muconate cycloisomerase, partial [Ferrovibrio sp.]